MKSILNYLYKIKSFFLNTQVQQIATWIMICILFVFILFLIYCFYPRPVNIDSMTKDIAFITQILSIIVAISLIGININLSRFNSADKLNTLINDIEVTSEPILRKISIENNKINNLKFIKYLFNVVEVDKYIFRNSTTEEYSNYYILRPHWDGVWYQISRSPFKEPNNKYTQKHYAIGHLHEIAICAAKILGFIYQIHDTKANLLSINRGGSHGSLSFLKEFDEIIIKYPTLKNGMLPDSLTKEEVYNIIKLIISSTHYMWEEVRKYSVELNWEPLKLGYFQVFFINYCKWLVFYIIKFQYLRIIIAENRFPDISKKFGKATEENLWLEQLNDMQQKMLDTHKKCIAELGVSRRYADLKKASIPTFIMASLVILTVVMFWPFRGLISGENMIVGFFSMLYAAGAITILLGIFFLYALLGNTKSSSKHSFIERNF